MSKKGKRLREFEKKNRTLTVREEKRASLLAFEDEKRRQQAEAAMPQSAEQPEVAEAAGELPRKRKKRVVVNVRRLVTIAVVFIFAVTIGLSAGKLIHLKSEKDALEKEQEELTELKEELTAELEGVNSEEYIEQQVRKSLRLVKKNEILFILPDDSEKTDKADADGSASGADKNTADADGSAEAADGETNADSGEQEKDGQA